MTRGSAVLVPPGSRGADAAFPPAPRVWVGDGIVWMGRYVSTPDSNSKNLDEAEIDAVAEAGGGLAYFVEQAEGTPVNSTLDDDRTLARQAVKLAKRWGLPKECPFWYAVDTSPFGHMPQIIDSFGVYRDEADGWPVAAYIGSQAGEQLLELGLIDYFHIPSAASWSETSEPQNGTTVVFGYRDNSGRVHNMYISPLASLRQHASIPYAGTRIDPNDTLLATPMWFPGRAPLDPTEDDMTADELLALNKKLDEVIAGNTAIWNVLTQPIEGTTEPSMQWCSVLTQSSIAKGQLQDQTAAAVVKALPADQGGVAVHHHDGGSTGPAIAG